MQFSELKTLTASWLDDLQFGYFTEAQVSVWLNNAQREVQKRLINAGQNFYLICVQTTLVQNQSEYVLPIDLKKINRVEVIVSGTSPNESKSPVLPITLNQQDLVGTGTGTPQFYIIKRNRIALLPAPDTALVMRLHYSYLVGDMTNDTDVPDVPESYHELIALLACEDGFIKDGRVPDLLVKKIKAYDDELKTDANERRQDVSREIRDTGSSDGGYFF